ncbi:MAG: UDP-N-acetylmuramoyl-tripeptide--D-alanyl-D-alanine ligase [Desulfomonile sp.]|nr:UDP-N-acetylmuramoyl-tripeptide--D-alanyl-D-alanine ligase [Desulfomonile sp.]
MRADSGPYIAADIVAACKGTLLRGDPKARFSGISTDSRDIKDDDLFVPLTGPNFDGHDFLLPALEAGARGSLVNRDACRGIHINPPNSVLIQVQDTLHALSDLASAHRSIYSPPLIAVTGSSGKTTVKEMIAAVLGRSHRPLVSQANFNNMVGLPMTVLNLSSRHTAAVVEAGINTVGEMDYLARAALPNVAVITTVGPVHLEGLGSVEGVAKEKFKLVRGLRPSGTAVLPADNPYIEHHAKTAQCRVVRFGFDQGDFRAKNVRMLGDETQFRMITSGGEIDVSIRVPGRHNVVNALAAAAAVISIGVNLEDVARALAEFTAPSGRMETVALPGGRVLLRDCYNANPQSVAAALNVLTGRGSGRRTLAVLGTMMELGDQTEALHAEMGRLAAELGVHRVVFVGSFGSAFADGFGKVGRDAREVALAADHDEAWKIIAPELGAFSVILVKGSRAMKMENIADRIVKEN